MHSTGSRLSLRFFVLLATPFPFFRNSILVIHNEIRVALFPLKCKRKGSYGLFICLLPPFFKQKNIKMRVKERTCYK